MTIGRKILGFLLSSCLSILILSVGLQFKNKDVLFIFLIYCAWTFYAVFSVLKPTEYTELQSLDDEIHEGDYVTHFKFVDDNTLNYVYKVLHLEATSTETSEKFVVYQAMYDLMLARTSNMVYGDPVVVTIQVLPDADGVYYIPEADLLAIESALVPTV